MEDLSVGFMSLLSEVPLQEPKKITKRRASLPQNTIATKFEPRMAFSGPLWIKKTGRWIEHWADVSLHGVFTIKRSEQTEKFVKQIKLKECTIMRQKEKEFSIIRREKGAISYKAQSSEDVDIWVPTLSQYCSEMYTHLRISDIKLPMVVWNSDGVIISVNSQATAVLGHREHHLIGKGIKFIMPPEKSNSNEFITKLSRKESCKPPRSLTPLTLVPFNLDEIYVLYYFGCFQEYEKDRFVLAFQGTSGDPEKFEKVKTEVSQEITWLSWI